MGFWAEIMFLVKTTSRHFHLLFYAIKYISKIFFEALHVLKKEVANKWLNGTTNTNTKYQVYSQNITKSLYSCWYNFVVVILTILKILGISFNNAMTLFWNYYNFNLTMVWLHSCNFDYFQNLLTLSHNATTLSSKYYDLFIYLFIVALKFCHVTQTFK